MRALRFRTSSAITSKAWRFSPSRCEDSTRALSASSREALEAPSMLRAASMILPAFSRARITMFS
ncbi:MAG: hypothetical protein HC923_09060 [Myxococcales bacterium]|nr:hypothetical protein [Myxococcales bacterium]